MSRPVSVASRPLTATEELEKLEQSITLTLQEIDHNFSKAHRIATSSILLVVEQYGENCRAVWDASKFWKQFFEAAANVSLSGYEELANDGGDITGAEETTVTAMTHDTTTDYTLRPQDGNGDDDEDRTTAVHDQERDESLFTDDGGGDLSGSTPRPPATTTVLFPSSAQQQQQRQQQLQFAEMDSPYENMRREMNYGGGVPRSRSGSRPGSRQPAAAALGRGGPLGLRTGSAMMDVDDSGSTQHTFDTSAADAELLAQHSTRLPDMSMTPRPSPAERNRQAHEEEQATARRQKDPLMHHVLDKTYRIQATPRRGISPMRLKVLDRAERPQEEGGGGKKAAAIPDWASSPMPSPEMAVPKLRSAAFMSPVRAAYRSKLAVAASAPRTPGVSVQTPGVGRSKTRRGAKEEEVMFADIERTEMGLDTTAATTMKAAATTGNKKEKRDPDEITWESSDEEAYDDPYGGMSPPKTISFALPPSKLLQTPAREASRRIVEDILLTAGDDLDQLSEEYSPTMVKMHADILDDTF